MKKFTDVPMCDIDGCNKPAVRNYQDAFLRWDISKRGDYAKKPEFITAGDETNVHLCEEHDTPDNYS